MKSISTLLVLALGILFSVTGCGGGGGGGSNPAPAPETNLAPTTLSGRSLVFQDPDLTSISSTYTFTFANYTTNGGDSGTYSYSRNDAVRNTAAMQIASSFAPLLNYQLTFTSTGGGTYLDAGTAKTSTFFLR